MNPIEILKREWHDQLVATLHILHGENPTSAQDMAIHWACNSLKLWLEAIPNAPPPLARKNNAA